jgi:hypothetical protein
VRSSVYRVVSWPPGNAERLGGGKRLAAESRPAPMGTQRAARDARRNVSRGFHYRSGHVKSEVVPFPVPPTRHRPSRHPGHHERPNLRADEGSGRLYHRPSPRLKAASTALACWAVPAGTGARRVSATSVLRAACRRARAGLRDPNASSRSVRSRSSACDRPVPGRASSRRRQPATVRLFNPRRSGVSAPSTYHHGLGGQRGWRLATTVAVGIAPRWSPIRPRC